MERQREFDKFIENIIEQSCLTGSRRFGVAKITSDYDYIVRRSVFKNLMESELGHFIFYDGEKYAEREEFQSFKTSKHKKYTKRIYNFIVVWNDEEYDVWENASEAISSLPKWLVKDKDNRVELFEKAKEVYRNHINPPKIKERYENHKSFPYDPDDVPF